MTEIRLLRIKVRLPVLLCAVKTVEGDFRFCWTITPNVGQTHKENPNLVRILYMVCTLNDIYKQYNKLHEHWYTKISSLAVSRTETRLIMHQTCIWNTGHMQSIAGSVHATAVWTAENKKKITLIVPIEYSLFADHRSVPSFGPRFFWLTYFYPNKVCALISR